MLRIINLRALFTSYLADMNDKSALIDTGQGQICLSDIDRYCCRHPKLWVYSRRGREIHRAEESRKDLDVFIGFREPSRSNKFCKHKNLINRKDLSLWAVELRAIANEISKETMVVLDPWCEDGLAYDDSFVIRFKSFRHKNT